MTSRHARPRAVNILKIFIVSSFFGRDGEPLLRIRTGGRAWEAAMDPWPVIEGVPVYAATPRAFREQDAE
jgi:hypothetical protein